MFVNGSVPTLQIETQHDVDMLFVLLSSLDAGAAELREAMPQRTSPRYIKPCLILLEELPFTLRRPLVPERCDLTGKIAQAGNRFRGPKRFRGLKGKDSGMKGRLIST